MRIKLIVDELYLYHVMRCHHKTQQHITRRGVEICIPRVPVRTHVATKQGVLHVLVRAAKGRIVVQVAEAAKVRAFLESLVSANSKEFSRVPGWSLADWQT